MYSTPLAKLLVGVINNILSLIDVVIGISAPVLFLSSIVVFPSCIGSLKVTLINVLAGTLTELFAGFIPSIVGAMLSNEVSVEQVAPSSADTHPIIVKTTNIKKHVAIICRLILSPPIYSKKNMINGI